jgi:hypothetical protein
VQGLERLLQAAQVVRFREWAVLGSNQ